MSGDSLWGDVAAFCLFVGYGRSGHSAIGSIVDAHPNAVVAHELNAVKRYFEGVTREGLFREIFLQAQRQAMAGRRSSRADGGSYLHRIEGQLKSSPVGVTVLGDKKGAGTTVQFGAHGFGAIDTFREFLGIPAKMLHVIRNPYDIVAAGIANGRSAFPTLLPIVAGIRQRVSSEAWLDVYYEDVLASPRAEIARILAFLGLPVVDEHVARCTAYLFPSPHKRRLQVGWSPQSRARVEDLIARFDFLSRYSWAD